FALTEASGAAAAMPATGRPRRWALVVVGVAIVAAVLGLILSRRPRTTAAPGVKRIAVLAFENMGAPEEDYFVDGMTDEVRAKLTMLPGVEVVARASSSPYKKTPKQPNQIARELDVAYLLSATVRWQRDGGSNRIHVTPELLEIKPAGAPASRWQQAIDAPLT